MGLCTLLSVAGIVPAVGDAAKVAGTLGEFIAKNIDDTPMIIKAITEVSSQFPDIAKYLPASTFDNIATSLKNGQALTKSEYLKLKEVFGLDDINDLPIVYNIAWYEQKAVIVLLALLHLGVKNIHLGPTLPAFLSPNVAAVLTENFGIAGIGTVEEDMKLFFGAEH